MTLIQEVKFILQGGDSKKLKVRKDGRLSKEVLTFLADNEIVY